VDGLFRADHTRAREDVNRVGCLELIDGDEHPADRHEERGTERQRRGEEEKTTGQAGRTGRDRMLTVDESNFSRARAFRRLFSRELDALTFAEQLEHCAADGRTMKKMLDAGFVSNEPEALVNQQSCNRATRHASSFQETTVSDDLLVD
jgi:hypothetical protein